MVAVLGFSSEQIRDAVKDMYTVVARQPTAPLHFPVGRDACLLAGYAESQIAALPAAALESFAGVGCPFRAEVIQPGQVVLDLGAGSGTDVMLAANTVGATGKVWALDMTLAMREKLDSIIAEAGVENVQTLAGDAENIPLPDASVDVVTSNGVLNLVPDKRRAISEIFRVLKPGGYAQIADIVIASPVTPDCEDDPKMWAECVVGATVDETYLAMFSDAGFENVEVLRDYDYFAHSPSAETREVAGQFGAHALDLRMRRGAQAPHKLVQWAKRLDPRRVARNVQRRGLGGIAALGLALAACYGTLAIVALMSVLGVSMVFSEAAWAGAIMIFALLATVFIAAGYKIHRRLRAIAPALVGTAVLGFTLYVSYNLATEIVGFVLLAVATWLDFDLRRWARVKGGKRGAAQRGEAASLPGGASA